MGVGGKHSLSAVEMLGEQEVPHRVVAASSALDQDVGVGFLRTPSSDHPSLTSSLPTRSRQTQKSAGFWFFYRDCPGTAIEFSMTSSRGFNSESYSRIDSAGGAHPMRDTMRVLRAKANPVGCVAAA
jgi:hypothetical protein